MDSILRPLVILIMLITLFEKLLPEGKMKAAGKTGLGLIMLLMLVTFLSTALKFAAPNHDRAAAAIFQKETLASSGSYLDAVLQSGERQLAQAAQNALKKAGYESAMVSVSVNEQGQIVKCLAATDSLAASALDSPPLPEAFVAIIANTLNIPTQAIIPFKEAQGGHGV